MVTDLTGQGASSIPKYAAPGHRAAARRAALDPMLTWMTPRLAQQAAKADLAAVRAAAAQQAAAARKKAQPAKPKPVRTLLVGPKKQ